MYFFTYYLKDNPSCKMVLPKNKEDVFYLNNAYPAIKVFSK